MTAVFANGDSVPGSVLIGTDGPRSQVRRLLLGSEGDVNTLDLVHSNIAVTYGDAEKAKFIRSAHPLFSMAVRPGILSFMSSMSHCSSLGHNLNLDQFKMFLIQKTQQTGAFRSLPAGWEQKILR